MKFNGLIYLILISIILVSCQAPELVPLPYQPTSAYDGYRYGLVKAGLAKSKMVQMWLTEGETCLDRPNFIKLPHQEALFFEEQHPIAYTYRFATKRGQIIQIELNSNDSLSAQIFLDIFRIAEDTTDQFIHVATSDSTNRRIEFEPQQDAEYVLRLQPEILLGGDYFLVIKEVPVFIFPVAGRTEQSILSVFGDARDAGRRVHEGNDIFASRHTPILAATSGQVRYAGERGLGGKQVWLRDHKRDLTVYFAHLDSIYVSRGQFIEAGDTIGTNGNSGNAATTNPHLHFGIYTEAGAIDPYHFIVPNRRAMPRLQADTAMLGLQVRARNKAYFDKLDQRYRNRRDSIPIHTTMKVQAATWKTYRVELSDGSTGYVRAGDVGR